MQGALEWQVGINTVDHLNQGIDDIEPFSPIYPADIRGQFAKCFAQALATLKRYRIELLATVFCHTILHRYFL